MSADVHQLFISAGNLLVLRDGRVGFIDFGIVGKISPLTFQALQAFLVSSMSADYDTMAKALITMGVTEETVIVEVCCGQRVLSDCVLMQHLLVDKTCIVLWRSCIHIARQLHWCRTVRCCLSVQQFDVTQGVSSMLAYQLRGV